VIESVQRTQLRKHDCVRVYLVRSIDLNCLAVRHCYREALSLGARTVLIRARSFVSCPNSLQLSRALCVSEGASPAESQQAC